MPEETDGQKEIKELQNRILNLEAEITKSKKTGGDEAQEKIKKLTDDLATLQKERDELKAKFWDGKERRGKERRTPRAPEKSTEKTDENAWAGGHYG